VLSRVCLSGGVFVVVPVQAVLLGSEEFLCPIGGENVEGGREYFI
jgi:hypothetical protein